MDCRRRYLVLRRLWPYARKCFYITGLVYFAEFIHDVTELKKWLLILGVAMA